MNILVGIDDLNLYASTLAVDFADIAAGRGNISDKELANIGFERRSVLPSYEDPITLGVNAAKPIVQAAGHDAFELLIVATETSVDYGKAMSTYVHRYLELGPHCRNFETKQACYAGTAAMQMAAAWVRSGVAPGKKALVVMTDIPRRHFNERAELSPGTAAIAISVGAEPRIFELETTSGYATQEVYDTARPTCTTEWIDPTLSLGAYLDLVELSWQKYQRIANSPAFAEHMEYMIYHTPLISLTQQAHQILLEADGDFVPRAELEKSFARMVEPSLAFNRQLGNTYSACLYVALAGLIHSLGQVTAEPRVGCFSYGSGACGEIYSGCVKPSAYNLLAARTFDKHLAARKQVSFAEYEESVLTTETSLAAQDFTPNWDNPAGHYQSAYAGKGLLVLENVKNYYRNYKWS